MIFKTIATAAITCLAAAITACSPDKVSFDTLETARATAKENAEFNARSWRTQAPVYADLGLISRGDSTQSPACPQGDGWASLDLVQKDNGSVRVKLKCSTVSGAIGCRTDTPPEEGRCNSQLPHPLPKIAK
jgi:hypothetical protein